MSLVTLVPQESLWAGVLTSVGSFVIAQATESLSPAKATVVTLTRQ